MMMIVVEMMMMTIDHIKLYVEINRLVRLGFLYVFGDSIIFLKTLDLQTQNFQMFKTKAHQSPILKYSGLQFDF